MYEVNDGTHVEYRNNTFFKYIGTRSEELHPVKQKVFKLRKGFLSQNMTEVLEILNNILGSAVKLA